MTDRRIDQLDDIPSVEDSDWVHINKGGIDYKSPISSLKSNLDLSKVYIFETVAAFKASLIEFPDGKTFYLKDRDSSFTKITGIGTANGLNIIASASVDQSLELVTTPIMNIRSFGALLDDSTDDVLPFTEALSLGGIKEITFDANTFISGGLVVPIGKKLTGVGNQPELRLPSGSLLTKTGSTLTNLKVNFDGGTGQLGESSVDDVTLVDVESYGSTNSGVIFNAVCDNIILKKVVARDNTKSGITVNQITKLIVDKCSVYNNGQAGLGIQNSDQVQLSRLQTNNNGTGGNYGGCSLATSTNVIVDGVISHDNEEHGIGLQGTKYFTVSNIVSYSNGGAGLNMQEDNTTGSNAHGSTTNVQSYSNGMGLSLKETVEDVLFTSCNFGENTNYSVRLVDIGASAKKSNEITFKNCNFKFTTGVGFANDNDSTKISRTEVDNRFQEESYPSLQVWDNITAGYGTTINTKGINEKAEVFPELFYIAGGTVQNTISTEAVKGRRITFITEGGVTFTHNTGGGLAKFRNSSLADVVLAANQSITYTANGTDWIENS